MDTGQFERSWRARADEVWAGIADWRTAHPKATMTEIEREVDRRLFALRARVLADTAMASPVAEVSALGEEERPRCRRCEGAVEVRGRRHRGLSTLGGEAVHLERSYVVCESCGAGFFPPR